MRVHFEFHELSEWNRHVRGARRSAPNAMERIVGQGCNNIKKDWTARWRRGRGSHIPHIHRAIKYEVRRKGPSIVGQVWVSHLRSQGVLGHFIEWGNTRYALARNAPIPGGLPALLVEEPRFVKFVGDQAIGLLVGRPDD